MRASSSLTAASYRGGGGLSAARAETSTSSDSFDADGVSRPACFVVAAGATVFHENPVRPVTPRLGTKLPSGTTVSASLAALCGSMRSW